MKIIYNRIIKKNLLTLCPIVLPAGEIITLPAGAILTLPAGAIFMQPAGAIFTLPAGAIFTLPVGTIFRLLAGAIFTKLDLITFLQKTNKYTIETYFTCTQKKCIYFF